MAYRSNKLSTERRFAWCLRLLGLLLVLCADLVHAQNVTIDTSAAGQDQIIDGFGTCLSGREGQQAWWQQLYFGGLKSSMLRVDLTPAFGSPYSDYYYNSPWFGNDPSFPGPGSNNVRTYTNAADYMTPFAGHVAPIAVMGPDIDQNTNYFNFGNSLTAGLVAQAGVQLSNQLGGFKLFGSLWSPAPWVKLTSGNSISGQSGILPSNGTAWPFIWGGNFSGGILDVSGTPLPQFDDSSLGGTGPTSALTQFARCTAAYLRGFQNTYSVHFYAVSLQNELNFEEYYNSCTYPLSSQYQAALAAVRAELDNYPDLAGIQLMGPEDVLPEGGSYGMWQYGSGATTSDKNLQFVQDTEADPTSAAAEAFFCIHGYEPPVAATIISWNDWANGWTASPAPGIPANVNGFTYYGKKSWMTESSGENPVWLSPTNAFPSTGAWAIALEIYQALTVGQESAYVYWQMTDGNPVSVNTLTDSNLLASSAKYVAAKHYFRFIRPNAIRVNTTVTGSTNLYASAYYHITNQTLTVVLVNSYSNSLTASIQVPAQPAGITEFQTFTSSASGYWLYSVAGITNSSTTVTVPGYGVVTLYGSRNPIFQSAALTTNAVDLTWSATPGDSYQLQYATDLTQGNWTNSGSLIVAINYAVTTIAPVIAGAQRFYRVLVQNQ